VTFDIKDTPGAEMDEGLVAREMQQCAGAEFDSMLRQQRASADRDSVGAKSSEKERNVKPSQRRAELPADDARARKEREVIEDRQKEYQCQKRIQRRVPRTPKLHRLVTFTDETHFTSESCVVDKLTATPSGYVDVSIHSVNHLPVQDFTLDMAVDTFMGHPLDQVHVQCLIGRRKLSTGASKEHPQALFHQCLACQLDRYALA
jgi:hypothetical protein